MNFLKRKNETTNTGHEGRRRGPREIAVALTATAALLSACTPGQEAHAGRPTISQSETAKPAPSQSEGDHAPMDQYGEGESNMATFEDDPTSWYVNEAHNPDITGTDFAGDTARMSAQLLADMKLEQQPQTDAESMTFLGGLTIENGSFAAGLSGTVVYFPEDGQTMFTVFRKEADGPGYDFTVNLYLNKGMTADEVVAEINNIVKSGIVGESVLDISTHVGTSQNDQTSETFAADEKTGQWSTLDSQDVRAEVANTVAAITPGVKEQLELDKKKSAEIV